MFLLYQKDNPIIKLFLVGFIFGIFDSPAFYLHNQDAKLGYKRVQTVFAKLNCLDLDRALIFF